VTASRLRDAFVAGTAAWAALLVLVPLLASRAHASPLASALIVSVYALGSVVCHQLPERSYHLWAAQMPVCARCAGIYFGAVVGAIASLARTAEAVRHSKVAQGLSPARGAASAAQGFGDSRGAARIAQDFSPARGAARAARCTPARSAVRVAEGFSPAGRVRVALALAAAPTVLTLVYEWTTGVMPAHAVRAAAGVPIGLVVAWLVVAAAENQVD
jgi:hypothetical protein